MADEAQEVPVAAPQIAADAPQVAEVAHEAAPAAEAVVPEAAPAADAPAPDAAPAEAALADAPAAEVAAAEAAPAEAATADVPVAEGAPVEVAPADAAPADAPPAEALAIDAPAGEPAGAPADGEPEVAEPAAAPVDDAGAHAPVAAGTEPDEPAPVDAAPPQEEVAASAAPEEGAAPFDEPAAEHAAEPAAEEDDEAGPPRGPGTARPSLAPDEAQHGAGEPAEPAEPVAQQDEAPPEVEAVPEPKEPRDREPTDRELELLRELQEVDTEIAEHDEAIAHDTQLVAMIRDNVEKLESNKKLFTDLTDLSNQLAEREEAMEWFISKFSDIEAFNDKLNAIEETAASDTLSHIWQGTLDADDITKLDRAAVCADDVAKRAEQVQTRHDNMVYAVSELLVKCDQQKSIATMDHDSALKQLEAEFKKELRNLQDIRKRLKAHEVEQQFHIHRGTYIKDPPKPTVKNLALEKEADLHSQVCAAIVQERTQKENLEGQVTMLEREAAILIEEANKERAAQQVQTEEIRGGFDEVEWNCQLLEVENEDLMAVKKDIIAVTTAVKNSRKR